MNLLKKKTRKIRDFVSYDIWTLDLEELSKAKARFFKYLKVGMITRTFSNEKIGFQAVALSFFSTMSVVPFIAVAFTVSGGLGLADRLKQLLYQYFENSQQTIDTILGFADNIIQTSQKRYRLSKCDNLDDDVRGKGLQQCMESAEIQKYIQETVILSGYTYPCTFCSDDILQRFVDIFPSALFHRL